MPMPCGLTRPCLLPVPATDRHASTELKRREEREKKRKKEKRRERKKSGKTVFMTIPYDDFITGCVCGVRVGEPATCVWENRPHADAVRADACGVRVEKPSSCRCPLPSFRSGDSQARKQGGSGVG